MAMHGSVDYSYCKLNDGMESMDAIKLMDKIAETTKVMELKVVDVFFRTHGSTNELPYDFVLVDSPGSFANEAVNWQLARENDWWGQFGEEFEATMECSDDAVRYIGTYLTDPLPNNNIYIFLEKAHVIHECFFLWHYGNNHCYK